MAKRHTGDKGVPQGIVPGGRRDWGRGRGTGTREKGWQGREARGPRGTQGASIS